MRFQYTNVRVSPSVMNHGGAPLEKAIAKAIGLGSERIASLEVRRRSIDARKRSSVDYVLTVVVDVADADSVASLPKPAQGAIAMKPFQESDPVAIPDCSAQADAIGRPLIVGSGPAGLFCALYLARAGLRPLLVERGKDVERRAASVEAFVQTGKLDPNSNIQFGEGGAGTYSDGKLTTGTKGRFNRFVLEEFVRAGAPESILIDAKPHVGTDHLVSVVQGLRQSIIELGGEVRFDTLFESMDLTEDGEGGSRVHGARLRDLSSGEEYSIDAAAIILALGHSARDTYEMLEATGVALVRKPFAVGVRVEHPQALIDQTQYGAFASELPPADYKLSMRTQEGRGVYTFCMCPGGEVVAAASEEDRVCVNGMSRYARDGSQANAALLVEVHPEDLPGDDVLAGMEFQRGLERAAYEAACSETAYAAPAQYLGDFLHGGSSTRAVDFAAVSPTYPRGVKLVDLDGVLPRFITDSMREAIPVFDRRLEGYGYPGALLTAVESRSSAPVRILRDPDSLESVNVAGLYPAGEGAGYAGGIMSAAADGLKVASAICHVLRDGRS